MYEDLHNFSNGRGSALFAFSQLLEALWLIYSIYLYMKTPLTPNQGRVGPHLGGEGPGLITLKLSDVAAISVQKSSLCMCSGDYWIRQPFV